MHDIYICKQDNVRGNNALRIPKKIGQIWIGPKVSPDEWMQTWKNKHPDWSYTIYDNDYLAKTEFKTRPQIDEYIKRGWYAGAADLMRYEILYQHGGYLAGADSICLHPIDELLEDGGSLYTVYENEFLRGQLVAPIMASTPNHPFLKEIIERLSNIPPRHLEQPWRQTGNLFIAELIEELKPDVVIWPSHTLIPDHFAGRSYKGDGKIYAKQLFGETNKSYKYKSIFDRILSFKQSRYASSARKYLRYIKKAN